VSSGAPGRRMAGAVLAALAGLVTGLAWPAAEIRADHRPNVIVVLTDDQRWDGFDAMPWLRGMLEVPGSDWVNVPDGFANTPVCCPSRASLLTGRYARHTGVLDNTDGGNLDESSTLATWLHAAGYRTGLVGKYLNRYPFGRLPYVPPGWDRFVAKRNQSGATVYRDFHAVDQGSPVFVHGYATDWLAEKAVQFVRTAPSTRPFFLVFAPSAPHPPWLPAPRHEGSYADRPVAEPPNVVGALRGAPFWVRSLPEPSLSHKHI
jgi:N-acetylglucosamine-6-sulfatase